jgi:predicted AlkP superfamily phosphohydrolase/phosphomutase
MRIAYFLLIIALLPGFFCCSKGTGGAHAEKPVVVILGIDGADWQLIDPLIRKGRLPLFKKLKEQSAWGYLHTSTPAKSPIIWTSIATGKTQAKHGIDDFRPKHKDKNGKRLPYLSTDIREATLWDILDTKSLRSVLVNWFLSYPPQPLNGLNVSDYFRMRAFQPRNSKQGVLNDTVYPPARAAEFEKFIDGDYGKVLKDTGLPDFPRLFDEQGSGRNYSNHAIFKKYPEFVLQENLVQKVAVDLFRTEKFNFFAVYFKMADIVQHFAYDCFIDDAYKKKLLSSFADTASADRELKEAYEKVADILCPVYQNIEKIIKEYLGSEKFKNAYFMIVSDHGFYFFVRNQTIYYNHVNGLEKAPNGILLIKGPKVKPGKIRLAKIYDIAPTVLYLLNLPLDRRMEGLPLMRAFAFRRRFRYEVYQKKKPLNLRRNRELDEKNLQELKALGYIN